MLLSFRVENHKSIRDEQQLLLTPTYDDAVPEDADWEACSVAGIFGANASGKSNLLHALDFMRETVRWSMSRSEPGSGIAREPFALDPTSRVEPSTFVVDLTLSEVRHTYGFAIDDERVVEEWLYAYPKRRKRVLFEREGEEFVFGDSAPTSLRQVKDITGPNVLFLTVAARAASADVEQVYQWFSEQLVFAEERSSGPPGWLRNQQVSEEQMAGLGELLRSAGTGVRSVELKDGSASFVVSESGLGELVKSLDRDIASGDPEKMVLYSSMGSGKTHSWLAAIERLRGSKRFTSSELCFHHGEGDSTRPLSWNEESKGTRTLTALGYEAQRVLETGGVLVVDEIDASLHPYLSARVISLFQDEKQNPHGAQLIFTSHDATLLGRIRGEEVLRRDHIWFVEKDAQGRATLYPLSDFKPRGDDNRARRYLTGRYGAVPDVDDELFLMALHRRAQREESFEAEVDRE